MFKFYLLFQQLPKRPLQNVLSWYELSAPVVGYFDSVHFYPNVCHSHFEP